MKNAYIIDINSKLVGKTVLNDDEEIPQNIVLLPPPRHDIDNEVPVWNGTEWVIELTEDGLKHFFNNAREKRNRLLQSTDWTQLPDTNLTNEKKDIYKGYRQSLRDMFTGVTEATKLKWPSLPFTDETSVE
jgi:hypothetical protein